MGQMLGNSRTWRMRLCSCPHCNSSKKLFRFTKRAARQREKKLWRKEQT